MIIDLKVTDASQSFAHRRSRSRCVTRFIDHLKTAAHDMNKLMGTAGESCWCDGYDFPVILSPTNFRHRMRYLYLNMVGRRVTCSFTPKCLL